MSEIVNTSSNQIASLAMDEDQDSNSTSLRSNEISWRFFISLSLIQKLLAEFVGTYFLIFGGCAAVVVNLNMDKVVTLPGIAMVWGLIVMVMIYSVGHISGAHFNPAVTIAFASCNKFPWRQVPPYVLIQVVASTLASQTLRLIFNGKQNQFLTLPGGSNVQTLVLEFITTFYLMFVILAIATNEKAIKEFAGVAIGATVSIDILFSGPLTGASMNPARSLGPAIISGHYEGLWIYMVGPILGALAGAWVYEILRHSYKPKKRRNSQASSCSQQQSLVCVTMDEGNDMSCKCNEGWTCFITKTEPIKAGKAYYTCGGTCTCLMLPDRSMNQQNLETTRNQGMVFCKCDEGWSCVISKNEESQEGKTSFECGGGCVCVVDQSSNIKIMLRQQWTTGSDDHF